MADEVMAPRVPGRIKAIALLGGPLAWTLHLAGCYFVVALACTTGWPGAPAVVLALTVVLGVAAVASGILAFRRWRQVQSAASWLHALNEAGGEEGLLFLVGLMLAGLFALLIVMNGVSPLLVPVCAP